MSSSKEDAPSAQADHASLRLDWRKVADDRLSHLVDLEHDHSVMRDRWARLQMEHHELVVKENGHMQRIHELRKEMEHMDDRLHALARQCRREYEAMQATYMHSRSWRVTRPLRALSARYSSFKHHVRRVLRDLLRIRIVRRLAGIVVRPFPGLHRRLRKKLYFTDDNG